MIAFWAPGQPQGKGSAKGFFNPKLGRVLITNDNAKAKPWAAVITLAAEAARSGRPTLDGPVEVQLRFQVQRPKAHFNTRGELRATAPRFCSKKPDADKITRTVLDAITRAAVWRDDAQVAVMVVEKIYGEPGVHITVKPAE